MRKKRSPRFATITFMALLMFLSRDAFAEIRYVVKNSSECPTGTPTPACYTSVTDAINNASPGDSIEIRPGTYTGTYTLNKNVSIYGNETARTILSGGGAGPILTIDAVTIAMSIRRLTFVNASSGILVKNSPSVTISNNIFNVGSAGTAVQTTASSGTQVINNTFHTNGTGVLSDLNTLSIINNIFSSNGTAISANVVVDGILNNLFYVNTSIGPTGIIFTSTDPNYKGNIRDQDPLFVDPDQTDINKRDFHLESGTPCRDAGNATGGSDKIDGSTADIGAYGGSESDTIPFPVTLSPNPTVTPVGGTYTISLQWTQNPCYLIGGYKISYGKSTGTYTDSLSITNPSATTGDIPNLTPSGTAPTGKPVLSTTFENTVITLHWDPAIVTNETGYEIRYDLAPAVPVPPAAHDPAKTFTTSATTSSFPIGNLQNGTDYYFVIIPFAQDIYYITVQAFYAANNNFLSVYSNEESAELGNTQYGTPADEITEYPESIDPFPQLPNQGCFIATAAYGYYSAPEVKALREFRDRYLVANGPGRAFVRWYYRVSPSAAQYITEHPSLKPVVRVALAPAVGTALFMTGTSSAVKLLVFMMMLSLALYVRRKRINRPTWEGTEQ